MSAVEKITANDLLDAMAEADVLETFCDLPQADQEKFSRWIGAARDDESHWQRIHALVVALRKGPFQSTASADPVSSAGGTG